MIHVDLFMNIIFEFTLETNVKFQHVFVFGVIFVSILHLEWNIYAPFSPF